MGDSTETESEWVDFGQVARGQLGQQCQYARHYLKDPELSKDIRWTGRIEDYHGLKIHAADVEVFVARVKAWKKERRIG